jgi:hypothetical protein
MKSKTFEIELTIEDVQWAAHAAQSSFSKWTGQEGHYDNRLNSHFKGRLGEVAAEKFLLCQNLKLDSHFRFLDRENLSDIVVKINGYRKICRVEVKTWSNAYWQELGRCVSVDQYPDLQKKADVIIWCVVDVLDMKEIVKTPATVNAAVVGWSRMDDISKAPIKLTGSGGMREVENYQLDDKDMNDMSGFLPVMQIICKGELQCKS